MPDPVWTLPVSPVAVRELEALLPHRPPAVWVDQVVAFGEDGGECVIRLRVGAGYESGGRVRPTSYVEWVAQGFGYAVAAWTRQAGGVPAAKRAFLVSVAGLALEDDASRGYAIIDGEALTVVTRRTHQLGPITVVSGEVRTSSGRALATMRLKVFADAG